MESYPFYKKYMAIIQSQFRLMSRISSVLNAPKDEICEKNKVISLKMIMTAYFDELETLEQAVLQEQFNFTKAEILDCQQKMSPLSMNFTLFLN